MYKSLNDYLDALRRAGELIEIAAPVDTRWEIAELTDRMSKESGGGKALLFTDAGGEFPVAVNLLGSDRRICMALGVDRLGELTERIESLFRSATAPKNSIGDKLKMLPLLARASRWLPVRRSGRGACQHAVMKEPDLGRLPILTCWPHDGGPFVTLPMVHTIDPETGTPNLGMYRMQVFSKNTTGMHWHLHKTGAKHYEKHKKAGKKMPVTVCLGGDPVYAYSATAPLPENIDEYLLAGFIRNKPVELVKCLTNDLYVPSDCDFVIEGYVDPQEEKAVEGPFGDHTGFYSLEDRYPVFHVTCITHRKNPVYPATLVGIPPQEDVYIAKATEKIFLAPIRLVMQPEITDLYMPEEGVAHNLAVAALEKTYPGQPFKVASSLWGAGQMMFNKFILLTDAGTDIRCSEGLAGALENVRIPEDVMTSKGPLDVLDHTAARMGFGGKLCLDATFKGDRTFEGFSLPAEWKLQETDAIEVNDRFARKWRTLFLKVKNGFGGDCAEAVGQLIRTHAIEGIRFFVVFDANVPLDDPGLLIWYASSNCDAVRDVAVRDGYLVFDARVKAGGVAGFNRPWPNVVVSDRRTIDKVDARWAEYGIGPFIASPCLRYDPLLLSDRAEA